MKLPSFSAPSIQPTETMPVIAQSTAHHCCFHRGAGSRGFRRRSTGPCHSREAWKIQTWPPTRVRCRCMPPASRLPRSSPAAFDPLWVPDLSTLRIDTPMLAQRQTLKLRLPNDARDLIDLGPWHSALWRFAHRPRRKLRQPFRCAGHGPLRGAHAFSWAHANIPERTPTHVTSQNMRAATRLYRRRPYPIHVRLQQCGICGGHRSFRRFFHGAALCSGVVAARARSRQR